MSDELPNSVRAEQALLGILLHDYTAIERIPATFKPEHMHDAVHARLCEAILDISARGGTPDPIVLMERFSEDQGFQDVNGMSYLADLVDHAPMSSQVGDFCQLVTDLALRRETIRMCRELIEKATKDRGTPALDMIDAHERELFALTTSREQSGPKDFSSVMAGAIGRAAEAYSRDGELTVLLE